MMVSCPWLCACTKCLKLLNTSNLLRSKPLVRVALPASLLDCHSPSLWHVQGSTPTGVFKGGCCLLTNSSRGSPFQFLFFVASSSTVRMMACVVRLSPLEAFQQRAWMTASTSTVRLEVETILAALSSWIVVAPCLTVTPHPDWSLVTEPSVYIHYEVLWFAAFFCKEKLDL